MILYFKQILFLVVLISQVYDVAAQYLITGSVDHQVEGKIVHFDMLNEWNEFTSVSDEMTIKSVEIDAEGNFRFEGNELSNKKGFYRIRYTKIDQAISISSGPKNYVNFIFSNQDTIQIKNVDFTPNNEVNEILSKHLTKENATTQSLKNRENELHEALLLSKYRIYCKNQISQSSEGLSNLYCLATAEFNVETDADLYKKVKQELNTPNIRSSYFQSLEKLLLSNKVESTSLKRKVWFLAALLTLSLLANAVFLLYLFKTRLKRKIEPLKIDALTQKEKEVLDLIIDKKSNKEIAATLYVSDATIKTHINNIYRKLQVKSRKQVIDMYQTVKSTPV